MKRVLLAAFVLIVAALCAPLVHARREVVLLPYAGPISPAGAEYIARGNADAQPRNAV